MIRVMRARETVALECRVHKMSDEISLETFRRAVDPLCAYNINSGSPKPLTSLAALLLILSSHQSTNSYVLRR